MQLAAFTLPPAAFPNATLKILNSNQVQLVVPLNQVVGGRTADATPAGETTPTFDSPKDNQKAEAGAFDASAAALPLLEPGAFGPFLALLNPGVLLLFGPLILGVALLCPPCAFFNFLSYIPGYFGVFLPVPALALAATATVEETATVTPTLKTEDTLVSDSAFASIATAGPEDIARASETGSAEPSAPMLPSEPSDTTIDTEVDDVAAVIATEADEGVEEPTIETEATEVEEDSATDEDETQQEQTETTRSAKDVEAAGTDEASTGTSAPTASEPTAGSASDASTSASSSSTSYDSSEGDSSGGEAGGS